MRRFASTFIALLLALFTFNQVIVPHLLSLKDRTAMCDPLEKTAEETCTAPEFKLKEPSVAAFVVLFASLQKSDNLRFSGQSGLSKGQPPHGNHVPIYLDERVLRI